MVDSILAARNQVHQWDEAVWKRWRVNVKSNTQQNTKQILKSSQRSPAERRGTLFLLSDAVLHRLVVGFWSKEFVYCAMNFLSHRPIPFSSTLQMKK